MVYKLDLQALKKNESRLNHGSVYVALQITKKFAFIVNEINKNLKIALAAKKN